MDVQSAFDFDAAAARRDAGMASALDHAEADVPGWGDRCLDLMRAFAAQERQPWTCEEFRAYAYAHDLPPPDEQRAFGPVTQRAIRAGLIRRVGYAPAASSNGSPKPVYVGTQEARQS